MTPAAANTKPLPHRWLLFAGLAVFSLGVIAGLLRSAELVAQDFSYIAVAHREGRVAGASVSPGPGRVDIIVNDGINPRTYVVEIPDALSVYNLFRLAERTTSLVVAVDDREGVARVAAVNDVDTTAGATWDVEWNGEPMDDLNTPVVAPGDTIALTRNF